MLNKLFENTRNIASMFFVFSLVIFFLSLTPATFSAGYLAGAAGAQSGPPPGSSADYERIAEISAISSAVSGFLAAITGVVLMFLKMKEEKRLQLQFDVERQKSMVEIEQQRLEIQKQFLEIEKLRNDMKRSRKLSK